MQYEVSALGIHAHTPIPMLLLLGLIFHSFSCHVCPQLAMSRALVSPRKVSAKLLYPALCLRGGFPLTFIFQGHRWVRLSPSCHPFSSCTHKTELPHTKPSFGFLPLVQCFPYDEGVNWGVVPCRWVSWDILISSDSFQAQSWGTISILWWIPAGPLCLGGLDGTW